MKTTMQLFKPEWVRLIILVTAIALTLPIGSFGKENSNSGKSGNSGTSGNSGNSGNNTKDGSNASPVQSSARPFGLEIVGEVQSAATDDRSKDYQRTTISTVVKLLNDNFQDRKKMDDSRVYLDPSKLQLRTSADVCVYFVGEKTDYANTNGVTTPMGFKESALGCSKS